METVISHVSSSKFDTATNPTIKPTSGYDTAVYTLAVLKSNNNK
jgi:hypothetical protein